MNAPAVAGYVDLIEIGQGAFSRVYRGFEPRIGRPVAIKVLNFDLPERDRRRFEREIKVMGRVSAHHHIVTVLATAFTDQGRPCIVMEYYAGGSVAERVERLGRIDPSEAVEIGVGIASALATSHDAGVLHCDLKPHNILLSGYGHAALSDFGISVLADERTRSGQGSGFTLHYAAPEIVDGERPTGASDVYSLAATLYTSLSGQRPFQAEAGRQTSAELARRVLLEQPKSLVEFGVDPALAQVIQGGLAKSREERPESAAALANQLYLAGVGLGYPIAPPAIAASADSAPSPVPVDEASESLKIDLTSETGDRSQAAQVSSASNADPGGERPRRPPARPRRPEGSTPPIVLPARSEPTSSLLQRNWPTIVIVIGVVCMVAAVVWFVAGN